MEMKCGDCAFLLTNGNQNACALSGKGMPGLAEKCPYIDSEYRFHDGTDARSYVRGKYYEQFIDLYEMLTDEEDGWNEFKTTDGNKEEI